MNHNKRLQPLRDALAKVPHVTPSLAEPVLYDNGHVACWFNLNTAPIQIGLMPLSDDTHLKSLNLIAQAVSRNYGGPEREGWTVWVQYAEASGPAGISYCISNTTLPGTMDPEKSIEQALKIASNIESFLSNWGKMYWLYGKQPPCFTEDKKTLRECGGCVNTSNSLHNICEDCRRLHITLPLFDDEGHRSDMRECIGIDLFGDAQNPDVWELPISNGEETPA